ncbi:MAG: YitT family protein [Bacilli bacterium]
MTKLKMSIVKNFNLVIGILLVSIAFNLFLSPNDLAAGGIGGLALIFNRIYGGNVSTFILIANIILIVISYFLLGWKQTSRTILGSILFPIFVNLTKDISNYIDIYEADLFVKALFGGVISGYGYGIIFKYGYTSGGTDIIDQLVTKYYKVSMSTSIIVVDGLIVALGGITFGLENMIYSAIVLVLISIYSNKSMIGMNDYKSFYITTDKIDEIKDYLINTFHYDVTILDGEGGYSKEKRKIIMCVIRTSDYYVINKGLKIIDPDAFVIISNSYEAINHGHKQ